MKQTIKDGFLEDICNVIAEYFGEGKYELVDYSIHCGQDNVSGKSGLELGMDFIVTPVDVETSE